MIRTFDPWWGCTPVSVGCRECAGAELDAIYWDSEHWGRGKPRPSKSETYWDDPLDWDRRARRAGERARVEVGTRCDIFEMRADLDPLRKRFWALVRDTPHLDWLITTRRPQNFHRYLPWWPTTGILWPNVWLGVRAEDQDNAERRVPILLRTKAAVRYVAYDPPLGPLNLHGWLPRPNVLRRDPDAPTLDWVVAGTPRPRLEHGGDPERWVRDLRNQVLAAGASFAYRAPRAEGRFAPLPMLDGQQWDQVPA